MMESFETDRRVALTDVGQVTVSTVRLPQVYIEATNAEVVYETMLYDNQKDEFLDYQERAVTIDDAYIMHANAIIYVVRTRGN